MVLRIDVLATLTAYFSIAPALALDSRAYAGLLRLDPQMRLEQICDLEAMERIGRENSRFRPDRAKSDVISHPQHLGDILKAPGAAFRSNNNWYSLSFICKASPDHMKVLSFEYNIGSLIPESKLSDYDLWR
ncbi:DUF930 domain-containing protein [Methylocystis parvus]|uniref:DUF930 domain-containing protein n=1 Tax=Methylocystis parvus TaxID=134 RepID=A0A6B8M6L2_9HYPH|nr:DUF930 domain-containing protein [Methylocystis parvus]QGM99704.1 DUF930 domain-containing protein [Methylocystis parvus]WBK02033.1 DUF930 domain-containing protein [Methylocystis parvus OBBP]